MKIAVKTFSEGCNSLAGKVSLTGGRIRVYGSALLIITGKL